MEKLFQKYTDAFDSLDAKNIADLYMLPCSTSDGDGVNVFTTHESLVKKFTKNCESMVSMEYSNSQFNILDTIEMGDLSKTAIVGWRVYFQGAEIEFRALYICHKLNEEWRVFSANVYAGSFNVTNQ